mmetsp:Transcript_15026/g.35416  ORF Transcript_15026/g.35416 Transcript_15026/m.35416 type:complete len:1189 (-) Transcript_15026:477-4043(-)
MLQQLGDRGVHHIGEGLGVDAHVERGNRQQGEHDEFAPVDVGQRADVIVGDVAEVDPLDHPQRVGRTEHQGGGRDAAQPEVGLDGAEDHHPLADKAGSGGQAAVGHAKEDGKGGELGHGVDDAAIGRDLPRVHAVVEHADAQEHGARHKAVRDHLHEATRDAQLVEDEEAERHKAHVGDGRVGHQLLHVLLHQRDQADVDHGDQRHRDDQPGPLVGRIGRDRQRKAQEAVAAELQHDGRQHDRTAGRRLDVGIGQPGVHRPHRHLDREGGQEGKEKPGLGGAAQRQLVPGLDVKAARGLVVQVEQRDQHQQRAGQGVEEELEGRIDAVRAAPDADDDVHRDQGRLEEHVEQHAVQRAEHAHHQARQDQEGTHVLVHAGLDDLPGRDHDDHGDEGGQRHEPHRDAVHAQVVADIEALDPGLVLDELHRRRRGVEARNQREGDEKTRQRRHQRHPAHRGGLFVTAQCQQQGAADDGQENRKTQHHSCSPPRSGPEQGPELGLDIRPERPGHQPHDAEDHDEGVPVQIAGLHAAHQARDAADRTGRAVDDQAVDQAGVTALPETDTEGARQPGQHVLVEPVHEVLVLEDDDQRTQDFGQRGGNARRDHVEHIGRDDTGQGQPERQCGQAVQGHRGGAVELLGQFFHRRVGMDVDEDRVLEEVAEQHRLNRHEADDDRRNGQQHQRHPDHGRRFMRRVVMAVAMVIVMIVFAGEWLVVEVLLAVEDQEVHPERVEGRHEHADDDGEIGELRARQRAGMHGLDDRVLGIEAREQRRADQRQRPQQRGDPGDGHVFAQATHVADVLVMVHADDDRARAQEQQRLEEGMGHQVEDGHRVGRRAEGHGHVAELGQRRIRHHALDVVLDDAEEAHEQRRDRADHHDEVQRGVAQLEQRRHARHHEDAGRHHRRGVDQRGNRRWAFHRIRQPDMQRELGRLAHRTDEQADAGNAQQGPVRAREDHLGQDLRLGKGLGVIQRAAKGQQQADAQDEAEVADPVHQEGLHVGEDRGRLFVPEADQQIGHQAHRFPAEEQLQHVVAHHQHQHAEGEQRDVGEEALVAVVLLHVADGVDVHHQRHEGHDAHHHRGQAVDEETDLHLQAAQRHPFVDGRVEARAIDRDAVERHRRDDEGDQHTEDGDHVRAAPAHRLAEEAGHDGARKRRQRHRQQQVLRELCRHLFCPCPFSVSPSARRVPRH